MKPGVSIRKSDTAFITRQFRHDDLDDVIRLNLTCLPEHYPKSYFIMIYSSLPAAFRVAVVGNKIVGYTMGKIETGLSNFHFLRRAKKGHTISIAVSPHYRRLGIGTKLLLESLEAMKSAGATEAFLEVRKSNISAIKMYEKLGYITVKTLKRYYHDGEDALLMAKKLI